MRLSVVVPTHNRRESLGRVLDALEAQRGDVEGGVEVVAVDDGSSDGTAGLLAARGATVRPLSQPNTGPASARNRGAAAAEGELLLFLGDDTVPEPGFLAAHDRAHRAGGPRPLAVLGYTGWDRERMRVTPFLRFLNERGAQFGFGLIRDPEDVPFNFFYTSNVSLPRGLFLAEGGFDEGFRAAAWEDVEFAWRATRRAALRIVYRKEARTRHDHPTSLARFRARQHRSGLEAALFAKKHPELEGWLGADQARRLPPRPRLLAVFERAIGLLDPVGLSLPESVYLRVLRWDYLAGLREGISGVGTRPDGGTPDSGV